MSSSRNYIDSLRAQSLRAIETITLESDTLFAFGRADFQSLKNEGQHQLSAIASKLLNTPNIGKIIISGHADQLGDSQGNLQVSKQRAQTIRTYLVGKGVPAELVVAQGEGSRKPLVNCDMQQPRTQLIKCLEPNRRVEIEVRGLTEPRRNNRSPGPHRMRPGRRQATSAGTPGEVKTKGRMSNPLHVVNGEFHNGI